MTVRRCMHATLVVISLVSLALAGLGCGAEQKPKPDTPPKTDQIASNMPAEKPDLASAAAKAVPLPAKDDKGKKETGQNLLENGSFERWAEKVPEGWSTSGSGVVKPVDDAHEGKTGAALIKADEGKWSRLEYSLKGNKELPGKALEAAVFAKASAPTMLSFAIEYTQNGKATRVEKLHPGDGKWHELKVRTEIPAEVDPDSIIVKAFRKQGKDGDAVVDFARARIALDSRK